MPIVSVLAEATAMDNLGTVFTQIVTWFGNMVTYIISQPILLLPVGIFVAGATIGLASRLIGR